jgi:hypothetical protein
VAMTRTYLVILRAMPCGPSGMGARQEAQSIHGLLTSRATQRTPAPVRNPIARVNDYEIGSVHYSFSTAQ